LTGLSRILVVEDYPPLAKVIAIGLRRNGHLVERAGNVLRALETSGELDLVVVDIDLPDGSGIELATRLLEEGRTRRVVFFSATTDPELKTGALKLGPCVDKNDGVESLFTLIEEELDDRAALAQAVGGLDAALLRASARSGTRRRVKG
jgi:DNA-binding response OmpR family regulator